VCRSFSERPLPGGAGHDLVLLAAAFEGATLLVEDAHVVGPHDSAHVRALASR